MLDKINDNLARGRYSEEIALRSTRAWRNKKGGWIDYLISERMIFSHRVNDYTLSTFPEQLNSHDYFEIAVCASDAQLQYIADGQYIPVSRGTAILTKPDAMHMFRALSGISYDRYVIYFKAVPELFPDKSVLGFMNHGNNRNAVFLPGDDRFVRLCESISRELSIAESDFGNARALLRVTELFIALSESDSLDANGAALDAPDFIDEVKAYIDEEFVNIRSIGELAERFYYSREYLTRSFRRCYNTPIYEYILRRKLLYSCKLLREGATVERAAVESGFTNMSSFIKLFKKHRGVTPSEYKSLL